MRHILDRSMGLLLATVLCCAACGASRNEPPGSNAPPAPEPATTPTAAPTDDSIAVGSDPCQSDADCVPVCGCHPAACVAKATAPACEEGRICTQECRPGTMDCGGGCLCHEGRCAARLVNAPAR
ncbi:MULTISPECIES: hypothetical protein [Sorangium]|uniref:Secreted protein n=1 Tax=Sorangium cellulosum TaxID=56 RepID=A0A4P2QHG5_SORCE|nr:MULTISPECIES: hypothetical protein [Sorangium]AUX28988.1 hypothetical protein SOCE836_010730 [Sorangium cellulosum]WCQ88382.1 hypothetical protein NQZ70_01058 [Sorangium sp. Soce836]